MPIRPQLLERTATRAKTGCLKLTLAPRMSNPGLAKSRVSDVRWIEVTADVGGPARADGLLLRVPSRRPVKPVAEGPPELCLLLGLPYIFPGDPGYLGTRPYEPRPTAGGKKLGRIVKIQAPSFVLYCVSN